MTDQTELVTALEQLERQQFCLECPKPVTPKGKGRPPLYCGKVCRDKAWRSGRARERQETK